MSSVVDMTWMFRDASSFNQDLCDWGTKMNNVGVLGMFESTVCNDPGITPHLSATPISPLCYTCSLWLKKKICSTDVLELVQ